VVFADQAADGPSPLDPGSEIDGVAGLVQWRPLLSCLVRPVAVVVPGVLAQDVAEVPLAEDQDVVEALAA